MDVGDNEIMRPVVILVYPKIDFKDNYECTWLPYSVLYIADALRSQGLVDVLVYDANIHQAMSFEDVLRQAADRLLFVGFSIMTGGSQIAFALNMAEMVRTIVPNALRVFGGPHANVLPDETCRHPLVDMVSVGPGQYVIPKVVQVLLDGGVLDGVPGVYIKGRDGVSVSGAAVGNEWQADGLRDWESVDAAPYIKTNDVLLGGRVLNYIASFGCCYRCRFCYEQYYGQRYHAIPVDKVVRDVSGLIEKYGLTGMKFYDADFFVNIDRAERIYRGIHRRHSQTAWAASIHPNDVLRIVARDKLGLNSVATCGCKRLLMGVESGNDRVLAETVRKNVTVSQMLKAARLIDNAGIRGAYTFILGFPGETREEKKDTIDFAMQLAALPSSPEIRFHGFAPYPGTLLYSDAIDGGFVPPKSLDGWSTFDYYNMKTPWLTPEDECVIREWSKATGRRLVEKCSKAQLASKI